MSTFRSDSIISRQKEIEVEESRKSMPPERRPSLIDSKRPSSLPPIALPPEQDAPNPFAYSDVIAIKTQDPYIPMRKIYQNSKASTFSSSNPFLHEIEMGLENEVPEIDPALNPFLHDFQTSNSFTEDSYSERMVHIPSPPATSPPKFSSANPFFHGSHEGNRDAQVAQGHQRNVSQDSNISSGSGTLGRRSRHPLRGAVMGTSMVEFLRSQSEEQAEPV